jgi:hypothetical protein
VVVPPDVVQTPGESMTETQPLSDSDREQLGRKAKRARAALRICLGLSIAIPLAFVVFLSFTPTKLDATTAVLTLVICCVLAAPSSLKSFDLHRTVKRVDTWLKQGQKQCLTDEVTKKGPLFMVTVGEFGVAAWERSRELSVGDVVTVEYLPLKSGIGGIVGVLRVDGEPNPYFESAWRSGPPTA